MSVTVVGGDNLGGIAKNLYALGVTELIHISGRKAAAKKVKFSSSTAFVLVLTDYVNHNTAQNVKTVAKAQMIPVIYAKRSWRFVEEKLLASSLIS
ncbi:MAG: DUF2325 domain-containing protein [Bacillota bacterium]